MSKCGETYIDFYKLYDEYDTFLSPQCESTNPWISEVNHHKPKQKNNNSSILNILYLLKRKK